jgi:guanine deaminase
MEKNIHLNQHEVEFMREAIRLSASNLGKPSGGPFGAVVVKDGKIVGKGANSVTSTNDPTAHAEVVAIRDACKNLGTFQLDGCDIYSSCEPCPMCLGAIYWARPARLFYAANREDAALAGFDDSYIYKQVSLEPDRRDLPTVNLIPEEAIAVFKVWIETDQKIPY